MNSSPVIDPDALAARPAGARAHLVGAGGCGVSAVGHLLLDLGFAVTGSDLADSSFTRGLRARGALIHLGHDARHLDPSEGVPPAAWVLHTSAARPDNPELLAACKAGIPVVRRASILAAIQRRQQGVCVAGMHGKTTTSALLAFTLERLDARPSYAIGAEVPQLARHARLSPATGSSVPLCVVEADESDGTLLEFSPDHAILLNVDAEHLDHFGSFEAVCRHFAGFATRVRRHLVYCADDSRLRGICASCPGAVSYGFDPAADYRLEHLGPGQFALWHAGARLGVYNTLLAGDKNLLNCGAVAALTHRLGFDPAAVAQAMAGFRGAARRQQLLYSGPDCRVYDDYGHHPVEIAATLAALKALAPGRLLVAFQPHRYSRTQHLMAAFATAFGDADSLWLADIYSAGDPEIPGVSSAVLAAEMTARGRSVEHVPALDALVERVRQALLPGDWVLFIGAGDITDAARALARQLHRADAQADEDARPAPQPLLCPASAGTPAQWLEALAPALDPACVLRLDEPMGRHTTFRIGGRADLFAEPATEEDLSALLRFCAARGLPFHLIGRGSNLLVRDGGLRGVVIALTHERFSQARVEGPLVFCGAGARLRTVSRAALDAGLAGLEFLDGIPGSVGGAMRMNAGAHGVRFYDVAQTIRFMDFSGAARDLPAAQAGARYRGCPLFQNHIALSAVLRATPGDPEAIQARINAFNNRRLASQPPQPSAGCVFKNPEGIPAGRLVEELGLKGARHGGAAVSALHGNFIVNEGGATASDVIALIDQVRRAALDQRGIALETEVQIVGDPQ